MVPSETAASQNPSAQESTKAKEEIATTKAKTTKANPTYPATKKATAATT